MRRLPLVLLLIAYALTSSGFTLRAEFCCGAIRSIHLDARPLADCDPAKMKHTGKGPCCQQTEVAMQLPADQQAATVHYELPAPLALIPPALFARCEPPSPEDRQEGFSPAPHPPPTIDRTIFYCTYRI